MVVALSPRGDRLGYLGSPSTNFFAAVARNQKYAAYITAADHSEQNGPARKILEWTTARRSNASTPSFRMAQTNALIQ